jgi:hypothetical protein
MEDAIDESQEPIPADQDMGFDDYVAVIQALAEQEGATEPGTPYCDPEEWRDMYDSGLTPEEAWQEEITAEDI